ncbi:helix-turn-helix transcriptional regulator [Vibrio sp. S12_S33]|uniref:helix-turn-helix transcriptional regulator n=1 Tax=Vibrio sp. S12_S33 TaxID=2720223 RepID=UPI00177F494A|nr:AlpA family phage regulatory protein [Vibrio sp. S12_S33]MBD1564561.1 AlpA family phage regulatory protein [Vibrio sp. S12_S33]
MQQINLHEKQLPDFLIASDRLVREVERKHITSISRSQAWKLEQQGRFPKRITLGTRSVCWKLSDLIAWVNGEFVSEDL